VRRLVALAVDLRLDREHVDQPVVEVAAVSGKLARLSGVRLTVSPMGLRGKVHRLRRFVSHLGYREGLALAVVEYRSLEPTEVTVSHHRISHPVTLRSRSTDFETFVKVIGEAEYDVPELSTPPRAIVDAGANVGIASCFFAEKFPQARIIALEPEASNFDLLRKNVTDYPNVVCINKALWKTSGTLQLFMPAAGGKDAFRTEENCAAHEPGVKQEGSVECVSISDLMAEYGLLRIDLLKVDIEGAEKEVFADCGDWIDKVDAIVIELHDRFKRGCSQSFYNATEGFTLEVHKGENVFLFRESVASARKA
jgi:FkbM family methyltransferase